MTTEADVCPIGYVRIKHEEECVEMPTEANGSLLLGTIRTQFPTAIGLRYKTKEDIWRGVRISENNIIDPPIDGWSEFDFHIVLSEEDRMAKMDSEDVEDDEDNPLHKMKKMTEKEILSDLVVTGLPYEAGDAEVKQELLAFGELDLFDIKKNDYGTSRGFGFIRYKTVEAVKKCFEAKLVLRGREITINFPKDKMKDDTTPVKLFVGNLTRAATVEDLKKYMEDNFGPVRDLYICTPFKGFGFVTFKKQSSAKKALHATHQFNGRFLNVSRPSTRSQQNERLYSSGGGKSNFDRTSFDGTFRGPGPNPGPGFGGFGFRGPRFHPEYDRFDNRSMDMLGRLVKDFFPGGMPPGMPPRPPRGPMPPGSRGPVPLHGRPPLRGPPSDRRMDNFYGGGFNLSRW